MPVVGLFVTCLIDCLRPKIGVAAVKLLRATGARVVYPQTQTCCGQIAFNSGYRQEAQRLAEKCAAEFEACDYVVIPSGSCGGMFIHHLPELFDEDNPRIDAFRRKCMELSQYLDKVNFMPDGKREMTVTYHDSCAGLRELGVKAVPRRLLQERGVSIVEMPDCEVCCGFGGRFAEQFGHLSVALVDKKCANISGVAVDAVVAGDLGCLLHIEGRMRRQGNALPVLHWAEILVD